MVQYALGRPMTCFRSAGAGQALRLSWFFLPCAARCCHVVPEGNNSTGRGWAARQTHGCSTSAAQRGAIGQAGQGQREHSHQLSSQP